MVREVFAQYLGRTDPSSVKGAIRDLQDRVANLERKLAISGAIGWLGHQFATFAKSSVLLV